MVALLIDNSARARAPNGPPVRLSSSAGCKGSPHIAGNGAGIAAITEYREKLASQTRITLPVNALRKIV